MLLLRLVIVFLIFYIIIAAFRSIVSRGKTGASGKLKSDTDSEEMVLDPQCQSYVPRSHAVAQSGRYFCSRECARLYLSR
jgi:hypothetical protein